MTPEVALLHDVWEVIKSRISSKERVEVAEDIVRTFDDHIDISEVTVDINEFDRIMKTAIVSHFDEGYDEDDDNEYDDRDY